MFCITSKAPGLQCAYDVCISLTPKIGSTCSLTCSPASICVRFEAGSTNETKCITFPLECIPYQDCPLTNCFNISMTFTPVFSGITGPIMYIHKQDYPSSLQFLNPDGAWTGKPNWQSSPAQSLTHCFGPTYSGIITVTTNDGYNYTFGDGFWLGVR